MVVLLSPKGVARQYLSRVGMRRGQFAPSSRYGMVSPNILGMLGIYIPLEKIMVVRNAREQFVKRSD